MPLPPTTTELPDSWKAFLGPHVTGLLKPLLRDLLQTDFYPLKSDLYRAFHKTPATQVKVVLLGQDPYHGPGQAHGLAFSVPDQVALPPSLRNIFKELAQDLGSSHLPTSGDLTPWAEQGVLLLNTVLSVAPGEAGSHQRIGWQGFTDGVIQKVSEHLDDVVFILWGSYAQKKIPLIDLKKHCVLTSVHPSPLAAHRGFFGSRPFSKTNSYLVSKGKDPIHWFRMES